MAPTGTPPESAASEPRPPRPRAASGAAARPGEPPPAPRLWLELSWDLLHALHDTLASGHRQAGSPATPSRHRIGTTMGGTTTEHTFPARAGVRGAPRHARLALLTLLLLAVVACAAGMPATAAAGVDDNIAAILRQSGLGGSSTGVYVWDLDAARLIYDHNGSTKLAPASNMKLVTSAAALTNWGADHRFVTELYLPDTPGLQQGRAGRRRLPARPRRPEPLHALVPARRVRPDHGVVRDVRARAQEAKASGRSADACSATPPGSTSSRTAPVWKSGLALECGPLSALSGNQGLDNGNRVSAPATWAAKLMTEACTGRGHQGQGQARHRQGPHLGPTAQGPVLRGPPRHHAAHEPGERQLLRRDVLQGARQGRLRRRQHQGGRPGERGHAPRHRASSTAATSSRTAPASATATASPRSG